MYRLCPLGPTRSPKSNINKSILSRSISGWLSLNELIHRAIDWNKENPLNSNKFKRGNCSRPAIECLVGQWELYVANKSQSKSVCLSPWWRAPMLFWRSAVYHGFWARRWSVLVQVAVSTSFTGLCIKLTRVGNNWWLLQMRTQDFIAEPMCRGKSVGGNHQEMELGR